MGGKLPHGSAPHRPTGVCICVSLPGPPQPRGPVAGAAAAGVGGRVRGAPLVPRYDPRLPHSPPCGCPTPCPTTTPQPALRLPYGHPTPCLTAAPQCNPALFLAFPLRVPLSAPRQTHALPRSSSRIPPPSPRGRAPRRAHPLPRNPCPTARSRSAPRQAHTLSRSSPRPTHPPLQPHAVGLSLSPPPPPWGRGDPSSLCTTRAGG